MLSGSSAPRGSVSPSTKPSTAPSSFASAAAASPPTLPPLSASPRCSMPRCRRWDSAPHASCSTKPTRLPTQRWQIASRQPSAAPSSPPASSSWRCPSRPISCGGIVPETAYLAAKQELFHRNCGGKSGDLPASGVRSGRAGLRWARRRARPARRSQTQPLRGHALQSPRAACSPRPDAASRH